MPKAMRMAKTDAVKDNTNTSSKSVDGSKGIWQMWHQKGQRCPKGTVPIRRSTVHDVLRAKSLYDFGKKSSKYTAATAAGRRADAPDVVSGNGHEVCISVWILFFGTTCTCIDHKKKIKIKNNNSSVSVCVCEGISCMISFFLILLWGV